MVLSRQLYQWYWYCFYCIFSSYDSVPSEYDYSFLFLLCNYGGSVHAKARGFRVRSTGCWFSWADARTYHYQRWPLVEKILEFTSRYSNSTYSIWVWLLGFSSVSFIACTLNTQACQSHWPSLLKILKLFAIWSGHPASGHVRVNHMSWTKFKINLFITKRVRGPKIFSLDILDWFMFVRWFDWVCCGN